MPSPKITPEDVGTPRYYEMLRQEAAFWERVNRGQVDISVATWRRDDLKEVVNGDLLRRVVEVVAARGPRVLDLGCGNAWYSCELARRGCLVDAVDIAAGRLRQDLEIATQRRNAESWPGEVHFFVGDLNRLGLAPSTYDVVLAAAVLHHVLAPASLLEQVHRSLKPGGTLVCMDHMESSLPGRAFCYGLLAALPTEVPYRHKAGHACNRLIARFYRPTSGPTAATARFTLPERSPFEDISGVKVVELIRERFAIQTYETHLAFADVVSGHLRLRSPEAEVRTARRLRNLDDWLVGKHLLRGDSYFLIARKETGTP